MHLQKRLVEDDEQTILNAGVEDDETSFESTVV